MQETSVALIGDENLFSYFHTLLHNHFTFIGMHEKVSDIEKKLLSDKPSFILMQIHTKTRPDEIIKAKQIILDLGIPVFFLNIAFKDGTIDYITLSYPNITVIKPVTPENMQKSIHSSLINFRKMIDSTNESKRLKQVKQHLKKELQKHTNNYRSVITISNSCFYNTLEKTLYFENRKITFSKKETQLLDLLVKHIDNPVSYEMIELIVWDNHSVLYSTVRSLVRRIRNKTCANLITNIPGIGYKIESGI